jgi:hypothetical protein
MTIKVRLRAISVLILYSVYCKGLEILMGMKMMMMNALPAASLRREVWTVTLRYSAPRGTEWTPKLGVKAGSRPEGDGQHWEI